MIQVNIRLAECEACAWQEDPERRLFGPNSRCSLVGTRLAECSKYFRFWSRRNN